MYSYFNLTPIMMSWPAIFNKNQESLAPGMIIAFAIEYICLKELHSSDIIILDLSLIT